MASLLHALCGRKDDALSSGDEVVFPPQESQISLGRYRLPDVRPLPIVKDAWYNFSGNTKDNGCHPIGDDAYDTTTMAAATTTTAVHCHEELYPIAMIGTSGTFSVSALAALAFLVLLGIQKNILQRRRRNAN